MKNRIYGENGIIYLIKTDENGTVSTSEITMPDPNRKVVKMVDLAGREILNIKINIPYIEVYDDGTTQKKIRIE